MSTYNEAESFYEAADPNDDFDDLDPDPNLEGVNEADPEVPPDQDPPEDIPILHVKGFSYLMLTTCKYGYLGQE